MKRRTYLALFLTLLIGGGVTVFDAMTFFGGEARAESFESEESVEFTFNSAITLNISGDLIIEGLNPGDGKDSKIITVTVTSNSTTGYTLTSAVGATGNSSNELRKDGTDTTNKFSSLTANVSSLSSDDFGFNNWGYSYSTDSGSTWVSGDIGSTSAGYDGYTYTTSSSTVTHIDSSSSGTSSIQYKIGAKASGTQLAGNYTNTINFIGTVKPTSGE